MSVACARRTLLRWPNFSNLEGSGATLLAPVIHLPFSKCPASVLDSGVEKVPANNSFPAKPSWGVQLLGSPSQASALASFQQLQKAYKTVLVPTFLLQ